MGVYDECIFKFLMLGLWEEVGLEGEEFKY